MDYSAATSLAEELPIIEERLRSAGLVETANLMLDAVNHIQFEIEMHADAENQRTAALR